jgi:hypothetical protein
MAFWRIFVLVSALAVASTSGKVIEMSEDDWTKVLKGEWMIEL